MMNAVSGIAIINIPIFCTFPSIFSFHKHWCQLRRKCFNIRDPVETFPDLGLHIVGDAGGGQGEDGFMKSRMIVSEHKDLVYHVIHRMVSDTTQHEELFQEIFLNVLQGLPGFRGQAKLSTWIYSVAVRTCLNHLKKQGRIREDSLNAKFDDLGWEPEDGTQRASTERRLQRRDLDAVLNELPLKYRLPVTLFHLEGRSYREIQQILDLPEGTVKTNLYRGLRAMRNLLGGNLHDYL